MVSSVRESRRQSMLTNAHSERTFEGPSTVENNTTRVEHDSMVWDFGFLVGTRVGTLRVFL